MVIVLSLVSLPVGGSGEIFSSLFGVFFMVNGNKWHKYKNTLEDTTGNTSIFDL